MITRESVPFTMLIIGKLVLDFRPVNVQATGAHDSPSELRAQVADMDILDHRLMPTIHTVASRESQMLLSRNIGYQFLIY